MGWSIPSVRQMGGELQNKILPARKWSNWEKNAGKTRLRENQALVSQGKCPVVAYLSVVVLQTLMGL